MAGIFGFFDFTKEGKGVNKDEKRKNGFLRFFELYFRKAGKYIGLNIMYFITALPIIAFYFYLSVILLQDVDINKYPMEVAIFTIAIVALLTVFSGATPFRAGFTYIIRNYENEEHAWLFRDFFVRTKENIKQALAVFVIDIAVLLIMTYNIRFYSAFSASGTVYNVAFYLNIVTFVIYIMMQPYIWNMMVTFKLTLAQTYKNALILALAGLKENIIAILINAAVFFVIIYYLSNVFTIFLYAIFMISVSALITQINVRKVIKKFMLDKLPPEETEEADYYGYYEDEEDIEKTETEE